MTSVPSWDWSQPYSYSRDLVVRSSTVLLVRGDLAEAGCEGRGERPIERLSELTAQVVLRQEDRGCLLAVRASGKENERRVDPVDVVERVQRQLERLST